jgi:hypothetical protein
MKPLIECSENVGIVLKNKFQTSFRHSRISFLQNLQDKRNGRIKLRFIYKNPFEVLTLQLKVMNKFERGVGRVIFVDIFKHPL